MVVWRTAETFLHLQASVGITGAQLRVSLNPLNTIESCDDLRGFREAPHDADTHYSLSGELYVCLIVVVFRASIADAQG